MIISLSMTAMFLLCGFASIRFLLPGHRPLNRIWLGLALGLLEEMWLPALFSFLYSFTVTAHLAALGAAGILTAACFFLRDKRPLRKWDKKESVDALIKSADDKLYYAKNSGRNRVVSKIETADEDSSEENELEKLLISIGGSAPSNLSSDDESGHFENLSAKELEDILSGKADEDAALTGSDTLSAPITFSEDSYTDSPLLGGTSVK